MQVHLTVKLTVRLLNKHLVLILPWLTPSPDKVKQVMEKFFYRKVRQILRKYNKEVYWKKVLFLYMYAYHVSTTYLAEGKKELHFFNL